MAFFLQLDALFMVLLVIGFSTFVAGQCKAVPGSADWPSFSAWAEFNTSLGGQLIKPNPPGAVCHTSQPTYDSSSCTIVQNNWTDYFFHVQDPVSSAWQNFNNDTCPPYPEYSCSGLGYPQYVVNATNGQHVQLGINFARENNIRLIVKNTGHDYMGRSSAPNSLSIWTRNLQGFKFHNTFLPQGSPDNTTINHTAITAAAGSLMLDIYAATDAHNLTIVGGMGPDVGLGGYLTGGGHSVLSVTNGLAVDNVLELTLVTPSGDIIVANEYQNQDYFFAFRGGGGGTFGVLLSATLKTFPTPPMTTISFLVTGVENSDVWWEAMAYMLSQYPYLSSYNISGYPVVYPYYYDTYLDTNIALYEGGFLIHDGTDGAGLTKILEPVMSHIQTFYPSLIVWSSSTIEYPSFYSFYQVNKDHSTAGWDTVLGSRLLSANSLTGDLTTMAAAMKGFAAGQWTGPFLLGGIGVQEAAVNGGNTSVTPAWRNALLHYVTQNFWTPQNETAAQDQQNSMTEQVQFLIDLEPDSGSYINEANMHEPDWQTSFWGSNYPILLQIKKEVDPDDVFWCNPCVGNEGWEEVGDSLCQVGG